MKAKQQVKDRGTQNIGLLNSGPGPLEHHSMLPTGAIAKTPERVKKASISIEAMK